MIRIIKDFIKKFGFDKGFNTREKLSFAIDLIEEEVRELRIAFDNNDPEEIVDALGDILWLVLKLMIQLGISPFIVIKEIGRSNMEKIRGVKPGREQSAGFDVIKPVQEHVDKGLAEKVWTAPNHSGNWGKLAAIIVNGKK